MIKRKYIPHLAEFYFKPDYDWTKKKARKMYFQSKSNLDNKIFYEDCISGMKKRFNDNCVDMIICDPPFGISFSGLEHCYNRKSDFVNKNYKEIPFEEYSQFSTNWINEICRILTNEGSAYIVSGYSNLDSILNAIRESEFHLINHIIWHFNFSVFTKRKQTSSHFHILFLVKDKKKYFFNRIQHYNEDVWKINKEYMRGGLKNGNKLPEKLVQRMIDFSSKPGDLILDSFMGNGTTASVAQKNFRRFVGFEINEEMEKVHDKYLSKSKLGIDYKPYIDRIPTIKELSEKKGYFRAYKKYCENEGIELE